MRDVSHRTVRAGELVGLDLLRRACPDTTVRRLECRAVRPVFGGAPFAPCGIPEDGGPVRLWTQDAEGWLAADAAATRA